MQVAHEIRSGPGIAVNNFSHTETKKSILPGKTLIIDMFKSFEIYPVKWNDPTSEDICIHQKFVHIEDARHTLFNRVNPQHTGNIENPVAFEDDIRARCRALAVFSGHRKKTHAKVLRVGQTLARLHLGHVFVYLGSWC